MRLFHGSCPTTGIYLWKETPGAVHAPPRAFISGKKHPRVFLLWQEHPGRLIYTHSPVWALQVLHDGLLTAPLPTQATLARLHQEALAKLQLCPDDHPFLLIQQHHEAYNNIVQDLPPAPPGAQHALEAAIEAVNLTTLRQPTPTSRTFFARCPTQTYHLHHPRRLLPPRHPAVTGQCTAPTC